MVLGLIRIWQQLPRRLWWIAGGISVVTLTLILFLAQPNWDWFRPTLARMASSRLHRQVSIDGHLRVHLLSWTPTMAVGGLKIGEPDWARKTGEGRSLAEIDLIVVKVELAPLLIGKLVPTRLEIDRPVLVMFQDKDGRANWDLSNGVDPGKPIKLPVIKDFVITDAKISLTSLQQQLQFAGTINARQNAQSGPQAFGFDGRGKLNNKTFVFTATGGALPNIRTDMPYPFDLTVKTGDSLIKAKGRIIHPFDFAQMDGALTVSGGNLADLYYITGLVLPDTGAYTLSAQVSRNDRIYKINRIIGQVGGTDLEGALTFDTRRRGRPYVTGALTSRVLDFNAIGSLFGATAAKTPALPKLAIAPMSAKMGKRFFPDTPLDVNRIRGMDAHVHYRAHSVRAPAGMPLRQVSLGIVLDHGQLVFDPIEVTLLNGRLMGTARIDTRGRVQRNSVDLRLTGAHVQDFFAKAGSPPAEGRLDAWARASGTGNSVRKAAATADGAFTVVLPGGTIRQSLAEAMGIDATKSLFLLLSKDRRETELRCGIAEFRLQNGVMQAQRIVLDTGVVLVNGVGSVDLTDEKIKLVLTGKPKKFRLIRINAPIVIGGQLAAPKIGVGARAAVAQGGLAAAVNSVLPFVNLDYAKDADCLGLLGEASEKSHR